MSKFTQWLKAKPMLTVGMASALLAVGATATIALAAAPDAGNVIHACIRTGGLGSNGDVRIVQNAPYTCSSNETTITWNGATPGLFLTNLAGAQLGNADLRYRNFYGSNLSNGYFGGAQFDYANLTSANLSGASLGASFSHQDLSTTNITNAQLGGARLVAVDLGGTSLSGTSFYSTYLEAVTGLNGRDLRTNNFQDIRTVNSNISNVNLSGIEAVGPTFTDSNLNGADFSSMTLVNNGSVAITNSTVSGTKFKGANFNAGGVSQFSGITGSGTDFSGATLTGVLFIGGALTNPNFTNANLNGVVGLDTTTLTSPVWSNTICPDGTNSNSNGGTCSGHIVP